MLTRCPECHSTYKVDHSQLMAAHGLVRCGHCHNLFDGKLMILWTGYENSGEDLISESSDIAVKSAEDPGISPFRRWPASLHKDAMPEGLAPEKDDYDFVDLVALFESDNSEIPASKTIPVLLEQDLASGEATRPYSIISILGWSTAILLMFTLLLGQYVFFGHQDVLSRYPIVQRLCQSIECNLPPYRDLTSIELLDREVFTDPNAASALMITATIKNNAQYPQPFPDIQVSLADLQGEALAMRRFKPSEYLPESKAEDITMQPGISHSFKLEVRDPGAEVLAYVFDFF